MTRGGKTQTQSTRSEQFNPVDQDNPHQDLISKPLLTGINPEETRINLDDARVTIEMNQLKCIDVPVTADHVTYLTNIELAEAIRLYQEQRAENLKGPRLIPDSEDFENSRQSRGSVFDRIGDKVRKKKQRESDATRRKILAKKKEHIRREEEEKLEQKIQRRIQL